MAKILDKFFNRIIEGDLLELSEKEKKLAQYAPVFNATIEEDLQHETIEVVMEEADRNDILTNKYPVICLKVPDEENEGEYNYMFFKADVYNEHSEGIQYCLWLGELNNDKNAISKLELSFVWDGDEAKTVFAEQEFDQSPELPAISGKAGKYLKVNSGATGVEWGSVSSGTKLYKHTIRGANPGNVTIINNSNTAIVGWSSLAIGGFIISGYVNGPTSLCTVVGASTTGVIYGYTAAGVFANVDMGTFGSDTVTEL